MDFSSMDSGVPDSFNWSPDSKARDSGFQERTFLLPEMCYVNFKLVRVRETMHGAGST